MNDTHGEKGEGWYGFDLDGTLAKYDGWKGIDHIGEPVKPMVELIKRMHDEGKVVKIMTARVAPRPLEAGKEYVEQFVVNGDGVRVYAHTFVEEWCAENLGFIPDIVYQKDHLMLELYDDRVKQVVPNEGWLVEDIAMSKRQRTETTIVKHDLVDLRWASRIQWFLLGVVTATLAFTVLGAVLRPDRDVAERRLRSALTEYISSGGGAAMSACPFAYGYIPQELECRLARDSEVHLPWWRRLLHLLRGDYWCENLGSLPCARYEARFHKAKEDR